MIGRRCLVAAVAGAVAAGAFVGCGSSDSSPIPTAPGAASSTQAPVTTTVPAATSSASTSPTTATVPSENTTAPKADRVLEVPSHAAPTIDGVIESGEWDRAAITTMTDDRRLLWMHDGEALFVALEGTRIGAVNLALAIDDEIWILHSSAALGSARYQRSLPEWTLAHGFSWCCRSATDSTARLALLEEEGWQANIGFTGDEGVVEYQVDLPWNGALAAVSFQTESADPAFWPEDLTAAAREDLVGPPPATRSFDLNEWYTLEAIDV